MSNPKPESETPSENAPVSSVPMGAGDSLEIIASSLASSMPEVQEHAIAHEKEKTEQKAKAWDHLKGVGGESFDPNIHKVDKDGNPTTSPKGNLIKKAGRKAGAPKSESGSIVGGRANPEAQAKASEAAQARATGKMAAGVIMTLGMTLGGEEWHPVNDPASGTNEALNLETAFSDYFEATGKTDLPPSMVLLVAIGGYALPRFTMPKTQTRIGKFKAWIVKKAADRKLKKLGLKATPINEGK